MKIKVVLKNGCRLNEKTSLMPKRIEQYIRIYTDFGDVIDIPRILIKKIVIKGVL